MKQILSIPEIPDELRIAARLGKLVPFIGAGVSRLAGSPSWVEFADGAIDFFLQQGHVTSELATQFLSLLPRTKLSYALLMQRKFGTPINFDNLLHPENNPSQNMGEHLYGCLSRLSRVFVTTNHDCWLDKEYPFPDFSVTAESTMDVSSLRRRRKVHNPSEFTLDILSSLDIVIHLHGCLEAPDKMIMTTEQYAQHYANDRGDKDPDRENRVLTFLGNLFNTKNVLFIGYGLEELEILEHIIQKGRIDVRDHLPRHFILRGFSAAESELSLYVEEYYRGLGVQLIPFLRDDNDRNQLLNVLRHFANSMQIAPTALIQRYQEMRTLLHDHN